MNKTRAQAMLVVIRKVGGGGVNAEGNRFQVEGSVKFVHVLPETDKADTYDRVWQ